MLKVHFYNTISLQISHEWKDKVTFKIHRVMETGFLQPAAVTVYEYYSMGMKLLHGRLTSHICLSVQFRHLYAR